MSRAKYWVFTFHEAAEYEAFDNNRKDYEDIIETAPASVHPKGGFKVQLEFATRKYKTHLIDLFSKFAVEIEVAQPRHKYSHQRIKEINNNYIEALD